MTVTKQIICLAHSRKRSGICIAGKERLADRTLAWVRPVSARPDQEVSEREYRYGDGTTPQLLDVIDIPMLCHQPHAFQTENWLMDSHARWRKAQKPAEWPSFGTAD